MPTLSRSHVPVCLILLALLLPVPTTLAAPGEPVSNDAPAVEEKEPEVVLYMTEWCPYCRKAQKLLDDLEVEYVAKDIEKDPQARAEFQVKGKGNGGIPLLDFAGKMIRGYQEKEIRRLAAQQAAR